MRTAIRFVALALPAILFVFGHFIPEVSARLSLIVHGYPFARVVPKYQIDIFKYVEVDSFANRGIVFSGEKAVGMIVQPKFTVASFEPFGVDPFSDEAFATHVWFSLPLLLLWNFKWWLLAVQVLVVLYWLRAKERRLLRDLQQQRLLMAQQRLS